MNDRVLTALRGAGFDVRPTASLDHDGALFALTDDTLIYLDGDRAQAVVLRDVTRIHSDRDGVLRVETPAGTALTAPLSGFDVGRVQHFFAEVRHATARAKTLPTLGGPRSGSAWKSGWGGGNASAPQASVPPISTPTLPPREASGPASATPAPSAEPPSPGPITITTTPGATAEARPGAARPPAARPEVSQAAASRAEVSSPEVSSPEAPQAEAVAEPRPAAQPSRDSVSQNGAFDVLASRGEALAGYATTLRLLALLIGLAGLGVGALRWRDGDLLGGLWTGALGVALAFGLFVFAEAARVLGLLAQRPSARDG